MSVVERNVDMLLSTGAWPRIEKLIHLLSRQLSMNEETHYREFAIVVLNALCLASEAACFVAANDTQTIATLVHFIDTADQNMHGVMQTHGMAALRDSPEMMGTSVGMLRRAASMLRMLIKVPGAYKFYIKHQHRLLQFTMSQLMDSRVAGMIADTLFEMQEIAKRNGDDEANVTPNAVRSSETDSDAVKKEPEELLAEDAEASCSSVATTSTAEKDVKTSISDVTTNCNTNGDSGVHSTTNGSLVNGNEKRSNKRHNSEEKSNSPPSKRSCLQNGYEKKNGKIDNVKISEAHDKGAMTAVA
ncbi:unnamed protein product [Caenorhabditis auriculariae]|uniref:SWI/SNF-like complex subunit BAF250 C-terminal domain-containing protein n=1 Tax=Caenorhabditis auriculariae TaxID=2777116 RepID=A0A8S1HSZ3_9PELO|nr:unnamed protein product [Caenorhabditis auriculariae]